MARPNGTDIGLLLYEKLYLCRRAEELIIRLYPENEMKTPMHMSMGQEAAPAAVACALDGAGDVVATYRSHAIFLATTGDVDAFFGELYGRVSGFGEGRGGSMHLASPEQGHLCSTGIVGAGLPVAVGAAHANKRLANGRVATVFFGDGAVEEGAFWESLNVASVMRLPVLFVCEDNDYAVHATRRIRQGFTDLRAVVASFACHYAHDESNDANSIYRHAKAAIAAIRDGAGPALLHVGCCRFLEHVGIGEDFHIGYRPVAEVARWHARDCLPMQRERLLAEGLADSVTTLEQDVDQRIEAAIRAARATAAPSPDRLRSGVFHETA